MSKDDNFDQMMEYASEMMKAAPDRINKTPFAQLLKIKPLDHEKGRVRLTAFFDDSLVGSVEDGFVHGGVITTLLDNASGLSIATALDTPMSMATLDLRIDYMRPADPGRDIIGEAECFHITRSVAFVRGWAYHENKDKVIATSSGAFALTPAKDMIARMTKKGG